MYHPLTQIPGNSWGASACTDQASDVARIGLLCTCQLCHFHVYSINSEGSVSVSLSLWQHLTLIIRPRPTCSWSPAQKYKDNTSAKMNNTSLIKVDNTTTTEKKDWGEQLTLGLMIGGPIYLATIVLLVVFISKQ